MSLENYYNETHRTWDKVAQQYEDKFMSLDLYDETYLLFANSLSKQNASILELGCGPGNVTKKLLKLNPQLNILATDISLNMIELAKSNNPGIEVKVLDCREIEKLKGEFEGIMCGFALPYLSKKDCIHLISNCKSKLVENGTLYLSFVAGDYNNSGYISGSSGDRMYFYYHELETIKTALKASGFSIIEIIEKEYHKSEIEFEKHTIILARS